MAKGLKEIALAVYHIFVAPRVDREIRRAIRMGQSEFPRAIVLPKPYGRGMTERVVEILVARLTYQSGRKVLDVGHSNITNAYARLLKSLPGQRDITGIDIVPAPDSIRVLYTHSQVANIVNAPFPDDSFDLIWCISAIEHFGMDNSLYTKDFVIDAEMDIKALREMLRILRRGGMILLTVPYGKYEDHGWFRNYDHDRWQALLGVARPVSTIYEHYFQYSDNDGWKVSCPADLVNIGYSDHKNGGASGLAVALIEKQ